MNTQKNSQQIAFQITLLHKVTIELYEDYFKMLDIALKYTPDSEPEKLKKIEELSEKARQAMTEDMALFEKAIQSDKKAVHHLKDDLRIQDIYAKLKK